MSQPECQIPPYLLREAVELVATRVPSKRIGADNFQRRMHVGFVMAARLMEQLEAIGAVGPWRSTGRAVLIGPEDVDRILASTNQPTA